METLDGLTPSGNKPRSLSVWLDQESNEAPLHLWIHPPAEEPGGGWEIRLNPKTLFECLERVTAEEPYDSTTVGPVPRSLSEFYRLPWSLRALNRYAQFATNAAWDIGNKLSMYNDAKTAFEASADDKSHVEAFQEIFRNLKGYWQVFRPLKEPDHWPPEKILASLREIATDVGRASRLSLRTLQPRKDRERLDRCLEHLRYIKPRKHGDFPDMTVSKFLHFFNPNLFPIFDTAVVWNEVFSAFGGEYATFCAQSGVEAVWPGGNGFYRNYVCWAASFIGGAEANFMADFAVWFDAQTRGIADPCGIRADLKSHEATAFEFVAIGAAKLIKDEDSSDPPS